MKKMVTTLKIEHDVGQDTRPDVDVWPDLMKTALQAAAPWGSLEVRIETLSCTVVDLSPDELKKYYASPDKLKEHSGK
jgi:hypothetical protein